MSFVKFSESKKIIVAQDNHDFHLSKSFKGGKYYTQNVIYRPWPKSSNTRLKFFANLDI